VESIFFVCGRVSTSVETANATFFTPYDGGGGAILRKSTYV
jgi:hypothetical protein